MTVVAAKPLTACEKQIAALVAEGWTASEIAVSMGWKTHRAVHAAIQRIGWKLDGAGTPRERVAAWWVEYQKQECT